jgi:hypothetical protein
MTPPPMVHEALGPDPEACPRGLRARAGEQLRRALAAMRDKVEMPPPLSPPCSF